ncbi:MAG: hypothetical protein AAB728_04325 [Patescibacteria group bacterium]
MSSDGDTPSADNVRSPEGMKASTKASWLVTPEEGDAKGKERLTSILTESAPVETARYFPLMDTLRLYAGWLLAWYFVIYALAGYQVTRRLPFRIGLLEDFLASTLVAQISATLFLFLLFTSLHRAVRGGVLLGFLLGLVGVIGILLFGLNMR